MKKVLIIIGLHILISNHLYSQCPTPIFGPTIINTNDVPVFDNSTGCLRSSLLQDDGANVGVGYSGVFNYMLDVNGDINFGGAVGITSSTLRLGGNSILWHNGILTNLFLGVGSGNLFTPTNNTFLGSNCGQQSGLSGSNGGFNTFVGSESGVSNNAGDQNTFVGYNSGNANLSGRLNVFMGVNAGLKNTGGVSNIFIGSNAGHENTGSTTDGSWNTVVGFYSAYNNTVGFANCYYGKYSGEQNTIGDNNSFFGSHSGQVAGASGVTNNFNSFFGAHSGQKFNSGQYNLYLGYDAQFYNNTGTSASLFNNLTNSIAIGANTMVLEDNKMILGGLTPSTNTNDVWVGIGLSHDTHFNGPQNCLEINADPTTTNTTSVELSGLRFRQLRQGATGFIQPWGKVLTVDPDGDVVLTRGDGIGNSFCSDVNPIHLSTYNDDMLLYLDDHKIYYDGNGTTGNPLDMNNSIGLGYKCNAVLPGKLSVYQRFTNSSGGAPASTCAGYFRNEDESFDPQQLIEKWAVLTSSDGLLTHRGHPPQMFALANIGGEFQARNCEIYNIGVKGIGGNGPGDVPPENLNYGGWFDGSYAISSNIGVYAQTNGGGAQNYGIYASAPNNSSCGNGPPSSCTEAAGFFNGDVYSLTAYYVSDMQLKDNVQPLQNSIDLINALRPKSYSFKTNQFPYLNLETGSQIGLIAQEVEMVLPELVGKISVPARSDSSGVLDTTGTGIQFKAINYVGLIPYLIGSIQEQQQEIDSMKLAINQMQSQLNNCCSIQQGELLNNNSDNSIDRHSQKIELKDINSIVLNQNSPNPFSEETYINYTIPSSVGEAKIIIYDKQGTILKSIKIEERGEGSLHIYAENLSSGIYNYSLIADGRTIDSKQMVCQK